jgi:hypothetical protein
MIYSDRSNSYTPVNGEVLPAKIMNKLMTRIVTEKYETKDYPSVVNKLKACP